MLRMFHVEQSHPIIYIHNTGREWNAMYRMECFVTYVIEKHDDGGE